MRCRCSASSLVQSWPTAIRRSTRIRDHRTQRAVDHSPASSGYAQPEPRLWPEYAPDYYAVFIRDPAGNNLELKCRASTAPPTHPNTTTKEHIS
jgi:hypothetical protein